jgi:hypothetical protein
VIDDEHRIPPALWQKLRGQFAACIEALAASASPCGAGAARRAAYNALRSRLPQQA